MKTKVFFDIQTETIDNDKLLISIGLVSECDKTLYIEIIEHNHTLYIKNIHINGDKYTPKLPHSEGNTIAKHILNNWLQQFEQVEMWGDCISYSWTMFCSIWKQHSNMPTNLKVIPFDIRTLFEVKGINPYTARTDFIGNINNDNNII